MATRKKPTLFISHAHSDIPSRKNKEDGKSWMDSFLGVLQQHGYAYFCSSKPTRGVKAGEKILAFIDGTLEKCSTIVCFVSENYLRSPFCLYELALCRFLDKKVVYVVHKEISADLSKRIPFVEEETKRIQLEDEAGKSAADLCQVLGLGAKDEAVVAAALAEFNGVQGCRKPYVGMLDREYEDWLKYLQENGISRIGTGHSFDKKEVLDHVDGAKSIYIVSTTGASLCKLIKEEVLPVCLCNGTSVHYIAPRRGSDFCRDVALAEERGKGGTSNRTIDGLNASRIASESDAVCLYLNEGVLAARQNLPEGASLGEVKFYDSKTLLRQTLMLVVGKDRSVWGWVTMTMPPLRSNDSLTLSIRGGSENKGLASQLISHCRCIMRMAEETGDVITLTGDTTFPSFKSDMEADRDRWNRKKEEALRYMQERKARFGAVLIEIAAQHPLFEGRPGIEFEKRLSFAMDLGKAIRDVPVRYYVPGSRHGDDPVSLSVAGKRFLVEHGIPEESVFGDEMNEKYKGREGVYNSADECFVAARIFKEGEYGRLVCVCSPYQTMRKTFNYIEFGVFPECYGIAAPSMFHDVVGEYFGSLRHVVHEDPDWQDPSSEAFRHSRRERCPDYPGEKK